MAGAAVTPAREWNPAGIVARFGTLVEERDGGDLRRAALRLGVPVELVCGLAAELADDTPDGLQQAARVLAAAARSYGVDATWLVTGEENFRGERLAPDARVRVADLLLRVADHLLAARRLRGGLEGRERTRS